MLSFQTNTHAFVSFETKTSFGYYKDVQQRQKFPLYLSWSYQGLHSQGIETSLQMIMNNNLLENKWKVTPAYGSVVVPLSKKYRSRVEAGRLFWFEGFELSLLDGIQMPIYWSQTGGIFIYGGSTQATDLDENLTGQVWGMSVFEMWLDIHFRVGWMGQDPNLKRQSVFGSIYREFNLPLSPSLLLKQEVLPTSWTYPQSISELNLFPTDNTSFSASYSYRQPRAYTEAEQNFLYRLFSISPQQTQSYSASWKANEKVRLQLQTLWMRYNSGQRDERAEQQDLSLDWQLTQAHKITPHIGYIKSYGGHVWNQGIRYLFDATEKTSLLTDISSAYIEKISGVKTWAGHIRSGLNYYLFSHTSASTWIELERNHIYEFDGRIMTYVTQYY
ncbi:MAG: hypothetical protein AB7F59_13150 [Bdellovibrionales bacterium]